MIALYTFAINPREKYTKKGLLNALLKKKRKQQPQRYFKGLKLNIQNLPPPNKESASCLHKSEKLPYETLPTKGQSYS